MENDIKELQEELVREEDSTYFRRLDAENLKREFQLATYKTRLWHVLLTSRVSRIYFVYLVNSGPLCKYTIYYSIFYDLFIRFTFVQM